MVFGNSRQTGSLISLSPSLASTRNLLLIRDDQPIPLAPKSKLWVTLTSCRREEDVEVRKANRVPSQMQFWCPATAIVTAAAAGG
eukprot:8685274-Ditylum_brightwellii.AAC.1